jgi:hypothetical protein
LDQSRERKEEARIKSEQKRAEQLAKADEATKAKILARKQKKGGADDENPSAKKRAKLSSLDGAPFASSVGIGLRIFNSINASDLPALKLFTQLPLKAPRTDKTNLGPVPVPQGVTDTLKYKVFSDLWHKNFCILPGIKYGGDFVAYPGYPWKVHSQFIVIVGDAQAGSVTAPMSIIAASRIAVKTKKAVLLATSRNDEIQYFTITWDQVTSNPPKSPKKTGKT